MTESTIHAIEPEYVLPLFGTRDQNLRKLREQFGVEVTHRNGEIRVVGEKEAVAKATQVLERMRDLLQRRGVLSPEDFLQVLGQVSGEAIGIVSAPIDVLQVGREVRPKTPGQIRYAEAIGKYPVVFAIGPAGTGKTYLAVAMAVHALKHRQIRKIVLVRPAVEAGESLGYLPGDLHAKINPYLRPLLDASQEMIGFDQVRRLIEQDVIEVAPLAYMRGRTLNDSFIILDEAQNTTVSQMKMFLTRMGNNSKIVVSGDVTQTDLPRHVSSGLRDAELRLKHIEGIGFVYLKNEDIVRHALVQEIVSAYERE